MKNNKIKEKIFQIMLRRKLDLNRKINNLNRSYEAILLEEYDKTYVKEEIRKISIFTDMISELIRRIYDDSKLFVMFEKNELFFKEDLFDIKKYINMKINKLVCRNLFINETQRLEMKNILFDIILYKILNDKNTKTPSQRAILFAKEFDKNIDIPFYYGINTIDGGDFEFINVYLNNGGNANKHFCLNYFSKDNIEIVSIKDYLDKYLLNNIKNLKK